MKKPPSYETQELREFGEVLQGRRTINLYLQTPVPDGLVHEAIEAADMDVYYSSDYMAAGGDGPLFSIAIMGDNWASFAEPDPTGHKSGEDSVEYSEKLIEVANSWKGSEEP